MPSYLSLLARAVTVGRDQAGAAVGALAFGGSATVGQIGSLADDAVRSGRANREALAALVRLELERALARLGLATGEEVRALAARLAAVEGAARAAGRVEDGTTAGRAADGPGSP